MCLYGLAPSLRWIPFQITLVLLEFYEYNFIFQLDFEANSVISKSSPMANLRKTMIASAPGRGPSPASFPNSLAPDPMTSTPATNWGLGGWPVARGGNEGGNKHPLPNASLVNLQSLRMETDRKDHKDLDTNMNSEDAASPFNTYNDT